MRATLWRESMPRWLSISLACLLTLGLAGPSPRAADMDTAPKVVKIPALIDAIKQHKGKVVVVDCWTDG
jgi:hypothetical protein